MTFTEAKATRDNGKDNTIFKNVVFNTAVDSIGNDNGYPGLQIFLGRSGNIGAAFRLRSWSKSRKSMTSKTTSKMETTYMKTMINANAKDPPPPYTFDPPPPATKMSSTSATINNILSAIFPSPIVSFSAAAKSMVAVYMEDSLLTFCNPHIHRSASVLLLTITTFPFVVVFAVTVVVVAVIIIN